MTIDPNNGLEFRKGWAGGCYVNGTSTCVVQPEDYCDEGTFVTSAFVRANKGHPLRYCAGDIEHVNIGRCGDSGECSNLASRCADNTTFVEVDTNCTTTQDLSNDSLVTYGKCGERCVWSPDDCLQGENYTANDGNCTANKVRIGACFAGFAFCSVSPTSCNQPGLPEEPYWRHHEVQEIVGANCFLSALPETPTMAPSRSPWTRTPTMAPMHGGGGVPPPSSNHDPSLPHHDGHGESSSSSPVNDDGRPSNGGFLNVGYSDGMLPTGGLVAIVAFVAVFLGILIGISTVYCRKEADDQWRVDGEKNAPTIPTEVVDIGHQVEYAPSSITDI